MWLKAWIHYNVWDWVISCLFHYKRNLEKKTNLFTAIALGKSCKSYNCIYSTLTITCTPTCLNAHLWVWHEDSTWTGEGYCKNPRGTLTIAANLTPHWYSRSPNRFVLIRNVDVGANKHNFVILVWSKEFRFKALLHTHSAAPFSAKHPGRAGPLWQILYNHNAN